MLHRLLLLLLASLVLLAESTPRHGFRESSNRRCPRGKIFLNCVRDCQPKCIDGGAVFYDECPDEDCKPGCVCPIGTIEDEEDGSCISLDECPPPCPPRSTFRLCGRDCPPTCAAPKQSCSQACQPAACECNEGYYMNKSGVCVRFSRCPRRRQPIIEEEEDIEE